MIVLVGEEFFLKNIFFFHMGLFLVRPGLQVKSCKKPDPGGV